MNKYVKAFNVLKEHANAETVDELVTLKELVEKATPKKCNIVEESRLTVLNDFTLGDNYIVEVFECPNCTEKLYDVDDVLEDLVYCPYCGQRLEWCDYEYTD